MSGNETSLPIVHRLTTTPSTQLLAAQRAAVLMADHLSPCSHHCEVWISESQLSGRGQRHRPFASPPGGFYVSMLMAVPQPLPMDILPLAVGWQCARLLAASDCGKISIRWPNDLCVEDKKVGGILCQSVVNGSRCMLLIGVGINTNSHLRDFPPEFQPYVASLADRGVHLDHECFLGQFIDSMRDILDATEIRRCAELAASLDITKGRTVTAFVDERSVEGISESWGADGRLRLRTANGIHELVAASISRIDGQKIRFEA